MEIIKYTDQWKVKWDKFVQGSNNGTMFHMQRFFDYHIPGKFVFDHLMFVNKNQIVAVLPGKLIDGIFESPIGASYGSIVTNDITFDESLELVALLLQYGKENGYKGFELTPAPMIYETYQNQNLDFAMLWLGFSYKLHYISSAIKLDKKRDIIQSSNKVVINKDDKEIQVALFDEKAFREYFNNSGLTVVYQKESSGSTLYSPILLK